MINPINPGPAGSAGPAGVSLSGPNPAAYESTLAYGTGVIGGAVSTALNSISSGLSDVLQTIKDAMSKAASSIATPVNLTQSVIDMAQAQAQASIGSQLASLPPVTPPMPQQPVAADRFYVIVQNVPPFEHRIYWQSPGGPAPTLVPSECIMGIFSDVNKATAYSQSIAGQAPPESCFQSIGQIRPPGPGGPSVVPPPPNGQPTPILTGPPGPVVVSPPQPPNPQPVPTVCAGGTEGPYALVIDQSPDGKTQDQCAASCWVGPFPSEIPGDTRQILGPYDWGQLQAQILSRCGQTIPPQPGPPTTPPTGGTPITLPACINIDLCDWQKFVDALVKALCQWYEKCVCKLDNQTSYQITDCDNVLGQLVDHWKGRIGAVATDNSVDDIVAAGSGVATTSDWAGTGDSPDPWR